MLQQVINNLIHDISLIQLYIKNNQDVGFSDMTRLLESLSIHVFKETHSLDLYNANNLKTSHPAIDLADDLMRVSIQVTTNADAKKIVHTLNKFTQNSLSDKYDRLIIFGFVKCSKPKMLPPFCEVINTKDLLSIVIDKNDEEVAQGIVDAIQQHIDFSRIHPYEDINCLEIVLNWIDRNAIKHRMLCEGSHTAMVKGLNEISELIGKGTINRRPKGKSLDDFQDPQIKSFLGEVKHLVGRIVGIVNECRIKNRDFVDINYRKMDEIDELKKQIIEESNKIALLKGINKTLYPI